LFLTHGEADAIQVLSAKIEQAKGWQPYVPEYGETVSLS
jgi:hypothetical protein